MPIFSKPTIDQERVHHRVLEDVYKKDKVDPLVLFVSGAAGTGKSDLIKRIVDAIGAQFVIVCGTTGKASKNVNGATTHSALNLNPYSEAKDDEPIPSHPFLLLLIIDEISMCDCKLFGRVEKRLRQLKCSDVPFGGCTVVLFGDLMQIPPVVVTRPYKEQRPSQWIFKSDLWRRYVQYDELEIVVRQEGDSKFAEMLKRWRVGVCLAEDHEFLNEKFQQYRENILEGPVAEFHKYFDPAKTMMILAHTREIIGKLNKEITYKLFDEKQRVKIVKSSHRRPLGEINSSARHNVSFEVALGSRVQINKNLGSFVNGDTGVVSYIKTSYGRVIDMDIKLDSTQMTHYFPMSIGKPIRNKQAETWTSEYHLQPSYALTYHKAQGVTLDHVFLSTKMNLPPALFYVGASRVRTREGLHILNYDAGHCIQADPEALNEYKRLRVSTGRSPLPI